MDDEARAINRQAENMGSPKIQELSNSFAGGGVKLGRIWHLRLAASPVTIAIIG